MKKVLYVTANPKAEEKSYSLQVGRQLIENYKALNPQDEVTEIEVYDDNIPLIDRDILTAWDVLGKGGDFGSLTPEQQEKVVRFNELTDQFIAADRYVFVTPMWNLSIPAMMRAYLDTVVVAGKTFKYSERGPVGLLNNKKAIHIHASGGVYSQGPAKSLEHSDSYLKAVSKFIGIQDIETIFVEGLAYDPQQADVIKEKAIEKVLELVKTF